MTSGHGKKTGTHLDRTKKLDSVGNSKALCGVLTCVAGMLSIVKLADVYLPIIVTECASTTLRVWPMKLNCQLKRSRGVA